MDAREFRRGKRVRALAFGVALVLGLAACGDDEGGTAVNPLAGSIWEVVSIHDGSTLQGANPTTIVTMVFDADSVRGYDGCNRYDASYGVDGARLSFGDVASTGASCRDVEHTVQAGAFTSAIELADGFSLSADELRVTSVGADVVRARPAGPLPLTGISWWLTGYRSDAGGLTSALDGAPVSLWLGTDGEIVGSAGCNSYSATLVQSGKELSVVGLAYTEMACSEPEGVMAQESSYLELLPEATSFRTDLTTLELIDDGGATIASYVFGGRTR